MFLKLLARAATGQTLSVYTTLITGPRRPGEHDGPEEFHLVLLDNGRSRVLATPFRESLQCIRCGACLNACPVYRRIGGHAYGGVYSGPDRQHPDAAVRQRGRQPAPAARLVAVRGVPGGVPGEDQHPAHADRPARVAAPRTSQSRLGEAGVSAVGGGAAAAVAVPAGAVARARLVLRPLARTAGCSELPGPGRAGRQTATFPRRRRESFRERWKEMAAMTMSPRGRAFSARHACARGRPRQGTGPAPPRRCPSAAASAIRAPAPTRCSASAPSSTAAGGKCSRRRRSRRRLAHRSRASLQSHNARKIAAEPRRPDRTTSTLPRQLRAHRPGRRRRSTICRAESARRSFAADVGISNVHRLIAETGTVVMATEPNEPRSVSLLPPVHIAVAERSQLLPDLFDLFDLFSPSRPANLPPSCLTLITGPSKTGDIELQLVTGVHGPGEVHVIVCGG